MSWKEEVLSGALGAARALRVGLEAQSSDFLVAVVDAFGSAPEEVTIGLNPLLTEITNAQRRRDHLRLADLLEFELPRALEESEA